MVTKRPHGHVTSNTLRNGQRNHRARWFYGTLASIAIWGMGTATGYWATAPVDKPGTSTAITLQALEKPSENGHHNYTSLSLYAWILGRNLAVYLWLLCGVLSSGLTTVAVLAFNGVALGQSVAIATQLGLPFHSVVLLLLPHGVPEFGAFCLAGAIGLQGPRLLQGWWRNSRTDNALGKMLRPALLGAMVLAAAAGIEVGVTLPLARSVASLQ